MAIIEPENLAAWLNISDSIDDTNLAIATAAANAAVTDYCGRVFDKTAIGAETTRVFNARNPYTIDLPDVWDITNMVVRTDEGDDGTYELVWTIGTEFYLTPINGLRGGSPWPYTGLHATNRRLFPVYGYRPAVQITAAWGWPAVPDAVFQATCMKAAKLFRRKDSPDGLLGGFSDLGAVRVSSREDADVERLLKPYVVDTDSVMIA